MLKTVRIGLNNSACTSNATGWLPNRKTIKPRKIKKFRFQSRRFWPEVEKKETISSLTKKGFDPLKNCDLKPMSMQDFAEAIKRFSPQNISHTAVTKPKMDFVRELISTKIVKPKSAYHI